MLPHVVDFILARSAWCISLRCKTTPPQVNLIQVPMSISSLVDTLAGLFPNWSRDELLNRLNKCDRIEIVIEDLIKEQEYSQNPESPELRRLQDILPDADTEKLRRLLRENEDDVSKVFEAYTALDATSNELMIVTGLLEDIIEPYLQRNGCRMLALADIMCNYRRKKRMKGSRVQDSRNNLSKLVFQGVSYTYNDTSREAEELRKQIEQQTLLQQVNYAFLVKCLEFFEGAVDRVLRVAYLFVDHAATKLTFDPKLGLDTTYQVESKAADILKACKNVPQKAWKFTPSSTFNTMNSGMSLLSKTQSLPSPVSGIVDLHGYLVGEAVQLAEREVKKWWNEEIRERQAHGILSKFGSRAAFVEPLDVITGRGLHSSGGPKLRKPVIQMLNRLKFLYREEIGRVVVVGRHIT